MHTNPIKNFRLIQKFSNKFLDKRSSAYKSLKAADILCREAIEKMLFDNPELKNLITLNNGHDLWIKELVVSYTLLKMHHHALLWEIDDHEPKI